MNYKAKKQKKSSSDKYWSFKKQHIPFVPRHLVATRDQRTTRLALEKTPINNAFLLFFYKSRSVYTCIWSENDRRPLVFTRNTKNSTQAVDLFLFLRFCRVRCSVHVTCSRVHMATNEQRKLTIWQTPWKLLHHTPSVRWYYQNEYILCIYMTVVTRAKRLLYITVTGQIFLILKTTWNYVQWYK